MLGLIGWTIILFGYIGGVTSVLNESRLTENLLLVSYPVLQVCFLIQGLLTMAVPILYTVVLMKTSKTSECIQTSRYNQQQKRFCVSYVSVVIICQLIGGVFLNTGEHKSTPTLNLLLNLLYFAMLLYLLISLYRFWRRTQILLSATSSNIDSNEGEVEKPHRLRRIWVVTLACTVIFGCGAIANHSAERDFWFVEERKGELVLKEYTGLRPYVKIPERINAKQVVRLDSCFKKNKFIKRVSIPQGITSIGPNTFASYKKLKKVEIPNSVKEIGYSAFESCQSLTKLTIPNSALVIEDEAFAQCRNLKTVQMPESLNYMASNAFSYCESLESEVPKTLFVDWEEVMVPEGVIRIPEDIFRNCDKLKYIHLPESLREIEGKAFAGCVSLETIEMPGVSEIAPDQEPDEVYQLPLHYKDFIAYGLIIEADTEEIVAPGVLRYVDVLVRNCYVIGIQIISSQCEDLEVRLPGGLIVSNCTISSFEFLAKNKKLEMLFLKNNSYNCSLKQLKEAH